jgi:hypothetical protein
MIVLFFSIFVIFFELPVQSITVEEVPIQTYALNRKNKRRAKIAICAMFKNEGEYLKEWIEYHRLIGVEHFYLYNNCSSDLSWLPMLNKYIKEGIVELFDVPFDSSGCHDGAKTHNFVQVCCYNHAIRLARDFNTWLAIIDSDEFICPVKHSKLIEVLSQFCYAAGLVLYWQNYGTSNVWDLNPGELLIEKLLYRESNEGGIGLFKSIVKPKYAECMDPHCCTYAGATFSVDPTHARFSHTRVFSQLPTDLIRINHYRYRTMSFYENVKRKRRSEWGDAPDETEERRRQDLANKVYDPVMLRFVPELKAKLLKK